VPSLDHEAICAGRDRQTGSAQGRPRRLRADQAAASTWSDPASDAASLAKLFGAPTVPEPTRKRTDEDRLRARMDWNIWPGVLEHLDEDPDDADDLYGAALCKYAIGQSARLRSFGQAI
jgi:hypothetical protein